MENIVRVGVGVIVINAEGKVLYGLRKSKHGNNTYSTPGGHLEFGETIAGCAIRELKEETNLDVTIKNVMLSYFTDDYMQEYNKHYITLYAIIKVFNGEVRNMEPHKLEEWKWMTWDEIKSLGDKNFLPMQNFIKKYPDFESNNI